MRAVIRKAQGQQQLMRSSSQGDAYGATVGGSGSVPYLSHLPNYGNSLTNGSSFSGGDFSNLASRMCNKPSDNASTTKASKNGLGNQTSENPNFSQSSADNPPLKIEPDPVQSNNADNFNDKSKNSVNNNSNPYQQRRQANTMLMSMLSDVPAANPSSASFPFLNQGEKSPNIPGKSRKRKKKSENRSPGSSGRSPKRKLSEDDYVRDRSTPDGEICDSPLAYEACSSLPASLPSTPADQQLTHRIGSVESFIKTEPGTSPGFPQRSASTDSYLMHEEFPPREALNVNDSSRLSEGGTPANLELVRNFSQVKTQYFGSDNILEMKPFLGPSDTSYGGAVTISSDIDMDDDNAYSMESSQSNVVSSKSSSEKQFKKKKYKEKSDLSESSEVSVVKSHDSSDESSMGDLSQKSFSETENSQSEDLSLSVKSSSHSSQPVFLGTSLKIAKSGDGHKVSKSETKVKLKESKKSSESSDKKKSDAKKERKRKRAENSGSSSGRSPVRPLHLNIDSSLMPPPSSSSDSSSIVSSADTQPIRPITLNVKAAPIVSSSSTFQSKSTVYSKKSLSNSPSSKNSSLKISSEKSVKPSPPRTNFPLKVSSSDSDSKKSNPTLKIPSKHKQSSSGKSSSGSTSHSSGRSSPSKPKSATIKLKNIVMPSAVTISPIISKVSSAVSPNDALVMQTNILNPGSPSGKSGSNNSKANKSALRSRKCSLSAVIDKLKVNAQFSSVDGLESPKCEAMRSDSLADRKESKLERKDNSKDSSLISKVSEKSKYSSSEQFTVKQSSGIKLTVTKTRASDGSSKSSKSKQSNKSSSVLSSSSLSNVSKSSSSNPSKCGNVSPASKKIYSSAQTNLGMSSKISNLGSGNSLKQNQQTSQKTSSPSNSSALSPRTSSSSNAINKSVSKHMSSSQSKTSGSMSKTLDKSDKKSLGDLKPSQNENKEMFSSSALNLMPPPVSKSSSESCRISSSSGSTPKRVDEGSRQSPRHTPTREILIDDMESDRSYRFPSGQLKADSLLSEQITSSKGPQMILPTPIDYCKVEIIKPDIDDKVQWIPNSDIKSANVPSSVMKMEDVNCLNVNDITCKINSQIEISSSNKYENFENIITMVPPSEDHSKSSAPLIKSLKQMKRPMERSGDDSSPEECLVIDCGSNEKWSSPCIDNSIILSVLDDEKPEKSPNTFLLNQPSLTKSPVQVLTPNHSLRPLSYAIDDDLMNEAVRPVEK